MKDHKIGWKICSVCRHEEYVGVSAKILAALLEDSAAWAERAREAEYAVRQLRERIARLSDPIPFYKR